MVEMDPIRYGIVGVGGFGCKRRLTLRNTGCYQIVGGVDIQREAFDVADQEEDVALHRYTSVEAMAADPRIEAIFISTPAHLHIEQAMIVAKSGKAVFVEKPLGHELQACRELVAFCESHHIAHGHGFAARFKPLWQHVKQFIDESRLGQIVSVSAATMHSGGLAFSQDNWRFNADENPGGPLFQCGIHEIDLLQYLFGEGRWLGGQVNRTVTPSETDDAYVLLGTFGHIPCTLHSHYVCSYRHAMEIYGTKGDLFIREFPVSLAHKITDLHSGFEPIHDLTDEIPDSDAEFQALRDFALAVREHRQPVMNGKQGLAALELVFSASKICVEVSSPSPCQV